MVAGEVPYFDASAGIRANKRFSRGVAARPQCAVDYRCLSYYLERWEGPIRGDGSANKIMFEGHDPYLVALSVAIAILGGYTGFALAARIRKHGVSNRVLLASAAAFLAVGIWTMHFVGMLAAPLPPDTVYLVLPTIISFVICALVVGISLFFVSIGEPSLKRVASSAVLLGVGIASMHYVGIHGLAGPFTIEHDGSMVVLAILIAIVAAYGLSQTHLGTSMPSGAVTSTEPTSVVLRRRDHGPYSGSAAPSFTISRITELCISRTPGSSTSRC